MLAGQASQDDNSTLQHPANSDVYLKLFQLQWCCAELRNHSCAASKQGKTAGTFLCTQLLFSAHASADAAVHCHLALDVIICCLVTGTSCTHLNSTQHCCYLQNAGFLPTGS
jgi:hypothetical protein